MDYASHRHWTSLKRMIKAGQHMYMLYIPSPWGENAHPHLTLSYTDYGNLNAACCYVTKDTTNKCSLDADGDCGCID